MRRFAMISAVVLACLTCLALPGVAAANQSPAAADDEWWTYQDTPTNIPVAFLLSNDSDPDNDPLTLESVDCTAATGFPGIVGLDVVFEPSGGFVGTSPFVYTVSDGNGGTAGAVVHVRVLPPSQVMPPPQGGGGSVELPADSGTIEFPPDVPTDAVITVESVVPTNQDLPPGNFHVGAAAYYEIHMDQPYTSSVPFEIALKYDDSGLSPEDENDLRLLHRKADGSWEDITWDHPSNPDTVNNVIVGYTTSLSPFAVLLPSSDAPLETPASSWWSTGLLLVAALVVLLSVGRRRARV